MCYIFNSTNTVNSDQSFLHLKNIYYSFWSPFLSPVQTQWWLPPLGFLPVCFLLIKNVKRKQEAPLKGGKCCPLVVNTKDRFCDFLWGTCLCNSIIFRHKKGSKWNRNIRLHSSTEVPWHESKKGCLFKLNLFIHSKKWHTYFGIMTVL